VKWPAKGENNRSVHWLFPFPPYPGVLPKRVNHQVSALIVPTSLLTLACSRSESTTNLSTREGFDGNRGITMLLALEIFFPGFWRASSASVWKEKNITSWKWKLLYCYTNSSNCQNLKRFVYAGHATHHWSEGITLTWLGLTCVIIRAIIIMVLSVPISVQRHFIPLIYTYWKF
jgi:hypothetical protein